MRSEVNVRFRLCYYCRPRQHHSELCLKSAANRKDEPALAGAEPAERTADSVITADPVITVEEPKAAAKAPISVIVPTKDEERNLEACLDHLEWADEVIIYDSHSTDRTVEIARARGKQVVQRRFDDWATHLNWGFDNIPFRHDWILMVDADERVTERLAAEITRMIADPAAPAGYYVPRRNWFGGKPIRCLWPDYNMRLIRRGKGRFEKRVVNLHMQLDGRAGYLKNWFEHQDDRGIERFFDRHNSYTSFEAVELYRLRNGLAQETLLKGRLFVPGPRGRRAIKTWTHKHVPARPLWFFLYLYVVKGGFLDGRRGFRYALFKALFEYIIEVKAEELEQPGSPLNVKYGRYLEQPTSAR